MQQGGKAVYSIVDDDIIIFDPRKENLSGSKQRKSIMTRKAKHLRLAFDKVCNQYCTSQP